MNTQTNELRQFMAEHDLTRRDVAIILGKKLNSSHGHSNSTVDRWLQDGRDAPDMAMQLLRLKVEGTLDTTQ